jgi:hypothetical protein
MTGVKEVRVDGRIEASGVILLKDDGGAHEVGVRM